jgi:hypothetical protein
MRKGHLKWTIAELSRKSKIPRTSIYYYLGKNKMQMLLEAIHFFGKFLAGLDNEQMQNYSNKEYAKAMFKSKQLLQKIPNLIPFYFIHRDGSNEIGEWIRYYEKEGINKRKLFFPQLSNAEALAIFYLQMGISLSSQIKTEKEISNALSFIKLND